MVCYIKLLVAFQFNLLSKILTLKFYLKPFKALKSIVIGYSWLIYTIFGFKKAYK